MVVVPPQAKAAPRTLKDLAGAGVQRIALGNPDSVPVGRYAKGALEAAGLWPSVQGKTITTQNVRQSLDYVARGEVDAGFVYATDAQAMPDRVRRAFAVPVAGRIAYPLAVTKASAQPVEAKRFTTFVRSAQGGRSGQAWVRQALRHGSRLERTVVVAEGGRLGHRDQSGAGRGTGRAAGTSAISWP